MSDANELLYPSLRQLVTQIKAINRGWKVAGNLYGNNSPLSTSSRDLKSCLQVRLLRNYAPKQVYLIIDEQAKGEQLYSLRLREAIDKYEDADHIPVREAKEILTLQEINKFSQK
ncbi:hypothetical protein IQ247_02655 [Plectonema cf. radiosum LEGE 06105]|uniref:Uncharacterized protein n=1 Tax=Plectonema cf. radiosum LEGE 06105 TaxID=945769 RepID=A0A8J7F278_9CYAN|nr:hypothetical protein [Plectonema radiosum]MBE9211625.1 hypothetical protein [Plectonema cf. radiosum LEGE 06105]